MQIQGSIVRMFATTSVAPVFLAPPMVMAVTLLPGAPRGMERLVVLLLGAGAGLVVWWLLALLTADRSTPRQANTQAHDQLMARVRALQSDIARHPSATQAYPALDLAQRADALAVELEGDAADVSWSSGEGYLRRWERLHNLEAFMVGQHDLPQLREDYWHDAARARGSDLDRAGSVAKENLDTAAVLLAQPAPDVDQVRIALRASRVAINAYRDEQLGQLIRARQRADAGSALLGLLTILLFGLTILFDAPVDAVASVSAYYLLGVIVALVAQQQQKRSHSPSGDIFGYAEASLRSTLQVAGITAVGGVALMWVLQEGTNVAPALLDLTTAIVATPANLLVAAAFGLAPALLIERLSGWARDNIKAIEDSSAGKTTGK